MIKRVILAIATAASVTACGSVGLLTSDTADPLPEGSCYLWYGQGEVIESSTVGTAVREPTGQVRDLQWPTGYTARRSGNSIEVLDAKGNVVAVTGRKYQFWTSAWGDSETVYTGGPGCVDEISSFIGG
jgi:hypothetical protein